MRKSIVAVALTAAASLLVAGVAPATAATSAEDKGVTLAKAIVAKYNKTPASIGITTPLKKVPPKGKYVIALSNGGDENKVLDEGIAAAAKTLGWKYKELVGAVTPETQRSLFSQALSLKPNYIHISGIEPSTLSDLLVKADKQGVVVVCSACMSKPVAALKDTHIAGPKMLDLWGQMIAAYVRSPAPTATRRSRASPCPCTRSSSASTSRSRRTSSVCAAKCTYEANPQQLTDIFAGKTPAAVVNIVNSNPGTNWIVSDLGGWVTGVSAALKSSNISGVQIGGLTAGKANIQGVKDGTESAWTGYSLPIVGWSVVDSMARNSVGQAFVTNDLPTQILTKQNASTLVLTAAGDYLGVKNYASEFKKLWGVK